MMRTLKPIERRMIALVMLLGVIFAVVWAVLEANRRLHAHYDNAISERLDQMARYNRIAASRGDYERAIQAIKKRDAAKYYLKSSAPALAAADIQQVVQTLAEADGLNLESMQIAPHKDQDGRRKVTVNLRMRGKLAGVRHLLYALETTQPYLFVDNLNLQATVRNNYVPVPDQAPDVLLQFDLSGYALLKTPPQDAAPRR